jgi:antitoxin CptB
MTERSKLRWRCRRGMKELDVLLQGYLERYYDTASVEEQRLFAELLELQDPQLYAYCIGLELPSDPAVADVIRKITTSLKT